MTATKENINIHRLIKASDSKFLKRLPGSVITLIKLIIRQNEINRILSAYGDYEGIEFLSKIKDELNINIEIDGIENLPENGKSFFVANHPFGFVDGLVLTKSFGSKYGWIQFVKEQV